MIGNARRHALGKRSIEMFYQSTFWFIWQAVTYKSLSIIRKAIFSVALFLIAGTATGQKFLSEPAIQYCAKIVSCENGAKNLSPSEALKLSELLKVVPAGASAREISNKYEPKRNSMTPPIQGVGLPEGTKVSQGVWYVTDKGSSMADPHIDVLFINGKASSFRWWIDGCCKRKVQVIYLAE